MTMIRYDHDRHKIIGGEEQQDSAARTIAMKTIQALKIHNSAGHHRRHHVVPQFDGLASFHVTGKPAVAGVLCSDGRTRKADDFVSVRPESRPVSIAKMPSPPTPRHCRGVYAMGTAGLREPSIRGDILEYGQSVPPH